MSHFAVAVISDGKKTVEELLAPYQENNMDDCPKEFLEFVSIEKEYRDSYENDGVVYVFMPDGRRLLPLDEEFRVAGSIGYGKDTHEVPQDLEQKVVPFKETYATFEDYMRDWHSLEKDPETGEYGYWDNPEAKWDWYSIGGRWRGSIKAKTGMLVDHYFADDDEYDNTNGYDVALLGYLDWERDEAAAILADKQWRKWVEGEEIEGIGNPWYKTEYLVSYYGNKDNYIMCESTQWWRAVITPDGKWHEVGTMGWFGLSSENNGEAVEWAKHFKERFIDPYPEQYYLTIVDCCI